MNTENEIKKILLSGLKLEHKIKMIRSVSNFNEEDIKKVLEIGGINVSEIYFNLIQLNKQKHL